MERPKVTKEMIAKAASQVAKHVNGDAETIAASYQHPMDGYQLARELDRRASWDLTMADVEELDCMSAIVSDLHREAERQWVAEFNPLPPLPVGAKIKEGVIAGICTHSAARYKVKEPDCAVEGRYLLVRYEDAVAV